MKAFVLMLALALALIVAVAAGMLRPTVGQFVFISTLVWLWQLLVTLAVVYWWRPMGLSAGGVRAVIISTAAVFLLMAAAVIAWRQQPGVPLTLATDGTIQTEVALQYLDQGLNPYEEDYYGTALENYTYPQALAAANPALEHFVYLPSLLWLSYPVYKLSLWLFGFYDHRFVLVLAFVILVWLLGQELKPLGAKAVWLAPLVIVSPWLGYHILSGQNDILPLVLVAAAFICWRRGWFTVGTASLALAATTKQTVWFLLPFAAMYLWQVYRQQLASGRLRLGHELAVFLVVVLISVAPFVVWQAPALGQDTVGYIMGTTQKTYPIWGVGLGEMLVRFNIVDSRQAAWPFIWLQLAVAWPLFIWLLYRQHKLPANLSYPLLAWGFWLGVSWLVGRFFAPAHLGFIITVLALAYLFKCLPRPADLSPAYGHEIK